jgi:nucleoside-diphosphate-sugar epimerase/tetratricopeptide (TPR) repeat protein
MTGKRVLVTGASGFVGRQTIGPLLDRAWEVHAVGNTVTDARARWYRGDLLDQATRRQMVAAVKPDALLHCAWVTRHGAFWTAPVNLDWVAASLDLVRAAVAQGTQRILMVGSCAEYDWTHAAGRPLREDDLCRPASLYGLAKDSLHRLIAAGSGASFVWARLFHLYGSHESAERLVPSLLAALRAGRPAVVKSGAAVRDFMHVADAGRALVHLLASEVTGAVNVASGQPLSIGDLAGMLARLAGRPDLLRLGTGAQTEPGFITADSGRLRASGFRTSVPLDAGLADLWAAQTKGQGAAPDPQRGDPPLNPSIRRSASDDPDYDQAARLYRANRRDEAIAAAEAVLLRNPDHAPALNLLGVLHRQRADFPRARRYLERAAARDPDNETAWINLGNVNLDMEAADDAVAAYERGLAAAPTRTDTLRLLGNALVRAGRDADAMARLDAAVQGLGSVAALRDRARAHYTGGRVDRALADLDAALLLRPGDVDLRLVKAQMLRLSGSAHEAAGLLRELVAEAPDHADVHLSLADALLTEERRERANEHYRKAVSLRPDDDQALGKLCWSLLNSRYGSEAEHIAEAAAIARQLSSRDVLHPASAHAVLRCTVP